MVMPWNDILKNSALIATGHQIFGSGTQRGTLAEIVARYNLTYVALPSPLDSGGEFGYQFKGKVPSDTDLARLVLEAEKLGFAASATEFALMQQLVVSQGDNVVLRVYAVNEPPPNQPAQQATGQTAKPTVNVTVAYVTDPTILNINFKGLINKAAKLYGLEKAVSTAAATP